MAATRPGRLEGKVCIVTGAGHPRGIGWTTIKRFAEEGPRHIYALDFEPKNFGILEEEARSKFPNTKVTFVQVDACDEAAIQGVCETAVQQEGRLDIFFANAGVLGSRHDLTCEEETLENFMRVLKNNVASQFLALKHAPKYMTKPDDAKGKPVGGGSIVLTASIASYRGGLAPVAYTAGKAATASMAQSTSVEFLRKGHNVRVNAVAPGFMKTELIPGGHLTHAREVVPEYFEDPICIANAVLYLASEEANFVNGETLVVDNTLINGIRLDKIFQ